MLTVRESNRWCAVEHSVHPTPAAIRERILQKKGIQSGFSILPARAPAQDDTIFKVLGNKEELLVGVAMFDSMKCLLPRAEKGITDSAEILFDPFNDQLSWLQAHFDPARLVAPGNEANPHRDKELDRNIQILSHNPYPSAYSSACLPLTVKKYQWRDEDFTPCGIATYRARWLFAWFRTEDVFRNGWVCGFNVCRSRPYIDEFSSWNYCSGNGSQDATGFGRLYLGRAPVGLSDVKAEIEKDRLAVSGRIDGRGAGLKMKLVGPDGEEIPVRRTLSRGAWKASARIDPSRHGRYRLYPQCPGRSVEPGYVSIDLPRRRETRKFCMSVLYDTPMSIISGHFTPRRLDQQMKMWAEQGIHRIHWLEYGDWPSFWTAKQYDWHANYARSVKHCRNLLHASRRAAHHNGLEFIGDLKTFDLGFNCFFMDEDGVSTVEDIEKRHVCVIPEIASHQEWTMRSNPEWRARHDMPLTKLRIFSLEPIPKLRKSDIRILVSRDNERYRRYTGRFVLKQNKVHRRHEEWTPAGNRDGTGSQQNWMIELSGLRIRNPFVAVQLGSKPFTLRHQGFMVLRAHGVSGGLLPLTVATNGSAAEGLYFWKGWQGWNNVTENLLEHRTWDANNIGLVLEEIPSMPSLLEPAFEGARRIWLGRVRKILRAGADGVDIRTYCHHNGPMHYLKYAFAKPVRDTFRALYGREPKPEHDDYDRIRRIRGDFYTQFMREAGDLVRRNGKKFIAELESGIEVPPSLNCRMQLALEWRRWIEERIVDEIRLKYWTHENPFIHEHVLPLARKHGVPVHIISRCLHTGVGLRAEEIGKRIANDASAAGFDGYCLYEQQNLMNINPAGISEFKGPVPEFMRGAKNCVKG